MNDIKESGDVAFNYSGSKVLVTGGSNGIGYEIARAYLAAGAIVTITGTKDSADCYENDLTGFDFVSLKVEDTDNIHRVSSYLNTLDILVNNAGASMPFGLDEWTAEGFEKSVQVNLFSAFNMAQACHPMLTASKQRGGASIVNIASLTSFFGNAVVPGYGAAKAALTQLTKTLAMKWADDGLRTNAVAAGLTETRMTAVMKDIPELNDPVIERTPLKRWAKPQEIADAVMFLTSNHASFITGQTLLVDGGYSVSG